MDTFKVWKHDPETDPEYHRTISAPTMADAVEAWAQWFDEATAEYSIVGGTPQRVIARDMVRGIVRAYMVHGDTVPEYSAVPLPPIKLKTEKGET